MNSAPIEGVEALTTIVTDLSAQRRAEESAAAARFTRSILEQLTEPTIVCDRDGRVTNASGPAEGLCEGTPIGRPFIESFPLEPDSAAAARLFHDGPVAAAAIARAVSAERIHGAEVRLVSPVSGCMNFLLSAGPLTDRWNQTVGCIVTLTDISERKRAEAQHRVLLAELNHRVKNNLAIVRSVASQTLRSSPLPADFRRAFDGRLGALSLAHDILIDTGWEEADLAELIQQIVAPYRRIDNAENIAIGGAAIFVPPQSVLPLATIFHELATNAAKYGALTVATGRVAVSWEAEPSTDGTRIRMNWREQGGPRVRPPTRTGFGSTLIKRTIEYTFDGEVVLDYPEDGFACAMNFSLRDDSNPILQKASEHAGEAGSENLA
jgi:two-component sensor histidine kinase